MKEIYYTKHLKLRLKFRKISEDLPREIYLTAKERYFDTATKKSVAVKRIKFEGKLKEIALIYEETPLFVNLITIHPLKKYQKFNRIKFKRWQKL